MVRLVGYFLFPQRCPDSHHLEPGWTRRRKLGKPFGFTLNPQRSPMKPLLYHCKIGTFSQWREQVDLHVSILVNRRGHPVQNQGFFRPRSPKIIGRALHSSPLVRMVLPMNWDEEHYQGYYLPPALGERIQKAVA